MTAYTVEKDWTTEAGLRAVVILGGSQNSKIRRMYAKHGFAE